MRSFNWEVSKYWHLLIQGGIINSINSCWYFMLTFGNSLSVWRGCCSLGMSYLSLIRCIPYICTEIFISCNNIKDRIVWCHSKHVVSVYAKEGLPFPQDLSLENSDDFYAFDMLYFIRCFNSFSLAVYVKEGLPFPQHSSLENSDDFYAGRLLLHSVL